MITIIIVLKIITKIEEFFNQLMIIGIIKLIIGW